MSTPFAAASAPPTVPPTREFTAAWIAYLTMALSAILLWPALIALVICYSKRGRPEAGFIDSHHRWILRSFWYSQLWFLLFFILIMIGVWPVLEDIARQVVNTGDWGSESFVLNINWGPIFKTVGAAMIGGLGIVATWFWFLYRMARGMIALADARALP
ncbi:MAG TPA: hypothetical protein VMG60_10950 [Burkholderiaceae bacterium]|nr:hypothetical protein [Burkholderiaceae bacterium]